MDDPTDLEVLDLVYETYYERFADYPNPDEDARTGRASKTHVPVDLIEIADEFGVDRDIVFGRFYYHLNHKYGYAKEKNVVVQVLSATGNDEYPYQVNFPLLAAALADLRDQDGKSRFATRVAVVSIVLSIASVLVALLT